MAQSEGAQLPACLLPLFPLLLAVGRCLVPLGWLRRAALVTEQGFAGLRRVGFVSEGIWVGGPGVEVGVQQGGKAEQSPSGTVCCKGALSVPPTSRGKGKLCLGAGTQGKLLRVKAPRSAGLWVAPTR